MARLVDKNQFYLLHGVRLVWVVDPGALTVAALSPGQEGRSLGGGATLDGGDVLPGLALLWTISSGTCRSSGPPGLPPVLAGRYAVRFSCRQLVALDDRPAVGIEGNSLRMPVHGMRLVRHLG
jgi:hypothetical protein